MPTWQRRALLRAAGVRRIDAVEKDECRDIRASREHCGCGCKGYCDPESCPCSRANVKCQVSKQMPRDKLADCFFFFKRRKQVNDATVMCVNRWIERVSLVDVLETVVRIVQAGSSLIQYGYEHISFIL